MAKKKSREISGHKQVSPPAGPDINEQVEHAGPATVGDYSPMTARKLENDRKPSVDETVSAPDVVKFTGKGYSIVTLPGRRVILDFSAGDYVTSDMVLAAQLEEKGFKRVK